MSLSGQSPGPPLDGDGYMKPKPAWHIPHLAILAIAALVPRIVFLALAGVPPAFLDAHEYKVMAENLLAGRDLNAASPGEPELPIRVPLYAIFVAAVFKLIGHSEKAVVAVQTLIASATILVLFLLARRYFCSFVALAAPLLVALHLPSIVHCGVLYPDTLFALLVLVFVYVVLTLVDTPNRAKALAAGSLAGLSTLCKAAGQGLIIILIVAIASRRSLSRRHRAMLCALAFAAFATVMAPWVVRNLVRFGRFVPTGTLAGFNFLTGNYEELVPPKGVARPALPPGMLENASKMDWIDRDRYFFREGIRVFFRNLTSLPKRALIKTAILFIDYPRCSLIDNIAYDAVISQRTSRILVVAGAVQNSIYILLGLCGVFVCIRSNKNLTLLAGAVLLYFWAGYTLTRSLSRYSVTFYPLICLFSGCALGLLRKRKR